MFLYKFGIGLFDKNNFKKCVIGQKKKKIYKGVFISSCPNKGWNHYIIFEQGQRIK